MATETTSLGSAGAVNVPVGDIEVTAVRAEDDVTTALGSSFIRAGWLTALVMVPNQ